MANYIEIPTYSSVTKIWDTTVFSTRESFVEFLWSCWKEPGKYDFDETSYDFNEQARIFNKRGFYCSAPFMSRDFLDYWDTEKNKCRKGVIFYGTRGQVWYLARDYYMWLNFLPLYDKEEAKFGFPKVRDAQYHMQLYEEIAKQSYKHVAIIKKRQIASSYYHMGKMINYFWFEEGWVNKMAASLKDYINEKGSWRFLEEYRNFLNANTAWYRPCNPDKVLNWEQKIEIDRGGRKEDVGLKSVIFGLSLDKDPSNGVGGPAGFFFHEEAGIAPRMNETLEYLLPALKSGMIYTGMFAAAGSVGDLDQCEPLKDIIYNPASKDVLAVECKLMDPEGTIGMCGLFIPEQWSMMPCIDEFGNSQVDKALEMIYEERKQWKKDLSSQDYLLRVSQKPTNLKEAFGARTDSKFPQHLVTQQMRRIEDKTYFIEHLELYRDEHNKIQAKASTRAPIVDFPISPKTLDKEGVLCVHERPSAYAQLGDYIVSIDPVSEGKAEYVNNSLYTPQGRKRIGDIKINDYVIGSNGQAVKVTGVYPQGKKRLCRVTFTDGFSVIVCEDHLWSVELNGGTRGAIILSTKQLMSETEQITLNGTGRNKDKLYTFKTHYKKDRGNRWKIPIAQPVVFQNTNILPIDPYLLGLLLGDGGLSQRAVRFSTNDQELVDNILNLLPDDLTIKKVTNSRYDYTITTTVGTRNSLSANLRELNLKGKKSINKFIPDGYKYSSVEDRVKLIQGLMDTDGYCGNHGAEYYTISDKLAHDMCDVVQSLGGIAKIRKKITNRKERNGVGYVYIVRVVLPPRFNPFKLKRKAELYYTPKVFSRYIDNITYEREDEAVCISVDAEDNLYLTEHAIVTHNTTTSESLCSIYVYKKPIEVTRKFDDGTSEHAVEKGKLVAWWCGRFDDLNKTHERLLLIIEWYNARALIENNISLFIQYMIEKRKQKYLVPKGDILFLKDAGANTNVFQEYGWKNTGRLFKDHLLSYGIQSLNEELDQEIDIEGNIMNVVYGVERIPDIMLLKEMMAYREGINVDRLVAYCALMAFVTIELSNKGCPHRTDNSQRKNLDNSQKSTKLIVQPFRHMGGNSPLPGGMKKPRNPFRNIR